MTFNLTTIKLFNASSVNRLVIWFSITYLDNLPNKQLEELFIKIMLFLMCYIMIICFFLWLIYIYKQNKVKFLLIHFSFLIFCLLSFCKWNYWQEYYFGKENKCLKALIEKIYFSAPSELYKCRCWYVCKYVSLYEDRFQIFSWEVHGCSREGHGSIKKVIFVKWINFKMSTYWAFRLWSKSNIINKSIWECHAVRGTSNITMEAWGKSFF